MNKNFGIRYYLLAAFLLIVCTSCQLPVANYFRDNVFPQDDAAKIALSPLLFPGYLCLSIVDVAIVNPARGCQNVPQVAGVIWEWENRRWALGFVALMPLKLVAIPPAAIGTAIFSEQFILQEDRKEQRLFSTPPEKQ